MVAIQKTLSLSVAKAFIQVRKSRLQQAEPFTVTGVDFTGALHIREAGVQRKVYTRLHLPACEMAYTGTCPHKVSNKVVMNTS